MDHKLSARPAVVQTHRSKAIFLSVEHAERLLMPKYPALGPFCVWVSCLEFLKEGEVLSLVVPAQRRVDFRAGHMLCLFYGIWALYVRGYGVALVRDELKADSVTVFVVVI